MATNMTFVDYVTPIPADWLNFVNFIVNNIGGAGSGGPSINRPASPTLFQSYFDTTLGYPIFCKQILPSVIWVNATGYAV